MSDFIVSARKYRPQTFDTVVGQHAITETLKKGIQNKHLAQAFLFCGSRGVGKTTTARILAKTINCFNRSEAIEACDTCDSCISFNTGNSLNVFELDGASNNSVDDIRNLIDQVRILPQLGTHKVFIIDEVHMLSPSAFNAFLKTLEEPPKHAIFILATTEKHKIIPTILSRCQIFDFGRIRVKDMAEHLAQISLKENVSAENEALHIIAMKADGSLRDALSIFDQIVTFAGNKISYSDVIENLNILDYDYYFKLTEAIEKEDISATLIILNEIYEKGFDGHNFIIGLAEHYRNLLVCKDERSASLLEVPEAIQQRFVDLSKEIDSPRILRTLMAISKTDTEFKSSKNQRLLIEVTLMLLCSLKQENEKKKSLTDRIDILPSAIQTLRKKQKVEKPKEIPVKKVIEKEEETLKIVSEPSGKLNQVHLSIKNIIENDKKKIVDKNNEKLPEERYSIEHLKMYWQQFAFIMKEKGMETFYQALVKREPLFIAEDRFGVELDNNVQLDYIKQLLTEFTDFLRTKLQNYNLTIELILTDNPLKEIKYLTGKDKFAAMASKNPNLNTLKNIFNLDIEY